ncbi:MAG: hypothetical protein E7546_06350 [Ruminococcaceae bacterium]|nr:hypothetical protein [Oscillospiraceae bacterium]
MKNKFSFVIILWWMIASVMAGVLLLGFADRESRESVLENRMLQGFPEVSAENIMSGDFSQEFEAWLSDGFFGRDGIINGSERIMNVFSAQTADDEYVLDTTEEEVTDFYEEDVEETEQVSQSDVPELPEEETQEVDFVETTEADKDGYYYFWYRKNNGKLQVHYPVHRSVCRSLADTLNLYRKELPEDGRVYYTIAPLAKNAWYWMKNRDRYCGWYTNIEDGIQKYCDDGVTIVNTPEILEPHMLEKELVYMRTDHHWSPLGAYYVCSEIIGSQGIPVVPYDEYTYQLNTSSDSTPAGKRDILNIMYPLQKLQAYRAYDGVLKKVNFMNYESKSYMAFLEGVVIPWKKFETGFHTGRNCLVIADSFGNVFTPYLTPYYDNVHMCDVRRDAYYSSGAGGWIAWLIDKYEIDDIYFVMSQANDVDSDITCANMRHCLYGN